MLFPDVAVHAGDKEVDDRRDGHHHMGQDVSRRPCLIPQRGRQHKAEHRAGEGDGDRKDVFEDEPTVRDRFVSQQQYRADGADDRDRDV